MYPLDRIEYERAIWQRKPQLRILKADYYQTVQRALNGHPYEWVELGSGCGGLKESLTGVIQTDIFSTPWVDLVMRGEQMAFSSDSLEGLIGVDVLHHLEEPLRFFQEAGRVLRTGGRLVLIEPYVSWGSWIPWHWLHHEGCSMKEPFDFTRRFEQENNARATLWFGRHRPAMERLIRPLSTSVVRLFDLFYYPLVGGFRRWSLIPRRVAPALLRMDRRMGPRWGRWFGYRMMLVLVKAASA